MAVLCNHQRAVPKTHEKSMENLKIKIDAKKDAIDKAEKEFKVPNILILVELKIVICIGAVNKWKMWNFEC